MVNIAPGAASSNQDSTRVGIDARIADRRKINYQTIVAGPQPTSIVSTASDCNKKIVISTKVDCCDNISCIRATHNQKWAFVNHPIVDLACSIVPFITLLNEFSSQASLEGFDLFFPGKHARHTPVRLTMMLFFHHKAGSFLRAMFV